MTDDLQTEPQNESLVPSLLMRRYEALHQKIIFAGLSARASCLVIVALVCFKDSASLIYTVVFVTLAALVCTAWHAEQSVLSVRIKSLENAIVKHRPHDAWEDVYIESRYRPLPAHLFSPTVLHAEPAFWLSLITLSSLALHFFMPHS